MEFETTLKIIVSIAAAVAIPVAAYAAVAATRAIWVRGVPAAADAAAVSRLEGEVEALSARVGELESTERRLLELEERLDFAERVLQQGVVRRVPRADTPPEATPAAR
jgi:hypothetical protein